MRLSAYAIDTSTGEVLIDQNSDLSLCSGSCMKIVTTAAALHLIGPDTSFKTILEYDGIIDADKILHGNIYVRGGGDPCLGSGRIPGSLSWEKQLDAWTRALMDLA